MADIVVCGDAVRRPLANTMLDVVHHVVGLRLLGHRVLYLEESGGADACWDPERQAFSDDPSAGLERLIRAFREFGYDDVAIWYFERLTATSYGLSRGQAVERLTSADLLLNLGGRSRLDEFSQPQRTAIIDTDPGFTQTGPLGGSNALAYDLAFSHGTAIGRGSNDCRVPDDGVRWLATVPPVPVDWWAAGEGDGPDDGPVSMTTMIDVTDRAEIEIDGEAHGPQWPEVERIGSLPDLVKDRYGATLVAAVDIGPEWERSVAGLRSRGWRIVDRARVTDRFDTYRRFVQASAGRFEVVKQAAVSLRTGVVTAETAACLATGRPVIAPDTGFRRPAAGPDGGMVAWTTPDEASRAVGEVVQRPADHRRAARELAATVFDHEVVLGALLDRCG